MLSIRKKKSDTFSFHMYIIIFIRFVVGVYSLSLNLYIYCSVVDRYNNNNNNVLPIGYVLYIFCNTHSAITHYYAEFFFLFLHLFSTFFNLCWNKKFHCCGFSYIQKCYNICTPLYTPELNI